ncbi:MAG: hypothetical protein HZA66_24345 [Rhodopseudomonas palustris]|uniref:AMP-binding enzyme C-terminal domain-containing protein n=1 Tax=Rhodopseudomonas palustris TaxID=1076 RepID=A0A933S2H8_RHOPL|nr:hypothetical protein [Rhodopseudomonas palustris]
MVQPSAGVAPMGRVVEAYVRGDCTAHLLELPIGEALRAAARNWARTPALTRFVNELPMTPSGNIQKYPMWTAERGRSDQSAH